MQFIYWTSNESFFHFLYHQIIQAKIESNVDLPKVCSIIETTESDSTITTETPKIEKKKKTKCAKCRINVGVIGMLFIVHTLFLFYKFINIYLYNISFSLPLWWYLLWYASVCEWTQLHVWLQRTWSRRDSEKQSSSYRRESPKNLVN